MEWTRKQLGQHRKAAALLEGIKNEAFSRVAAALEKGTKITEYDICQFILEEFEKNDLMVDDQPPIVAFGPSAADPHYDSMANGQRVIERGNVLLIDIWSKLNDRDAPFADITWMAWTGGKIPADVQKAFDAVLIARDAGLRFLEKNMFSELKSCEVDDVVRGSLRARGLDAAFLHGTGHHLDINHVHGPGYNFKQKDERELIPLTGATIEPGVYFPGKFGIRSECDIFLSERSIEITTPLQMDWVLL
jgi:Xaa-Pro aminopeptidase